MEQKYEVTFEKNEGEKSILKVEYSNDSKNILFMMNLIIQDIISKYAINTENIEKIEISKKQYKRTITIIYRRF